MQAKRGTKEMACRWAKTGFALVSLGATPGRLVAGERTLQPGGVDLRVGVGVGSKPRFSGGGRVQGRWQREEARVRHLVLA